MGPAEVEPRWNTERLTLLDPHAPVARVSRGDVSRDLWPIWDQTPVELDGIDGAVLEFELTYVEAPPVDVEPPNEVALRLPGTEGPTLAATLLARGPGRNPWFEYRVDLSGIASARGPLAVVVDGQEIDENSPYVVSVPRLHRRKDDGDRYNVLLVSVDTLRADMLGCYGYDRDTSPRIDALAESGVLFERAISQAGWTLPSYASVLTGMYPEVHRVVHRSSTLGAGFPSFVELFAENGYATAAIVSGTFTDAFWGFDQGFDSYDDLGSVTPDEAPPPDDPTAGDSMKSAEARITSVTVTDRAIAWMERNRDRRFLLLAQYFDPHSDRLEHAGITENFPPRKAIPRLVLDERRRPPLETAPLQKSLYEGEVFFTDQHIGRLLDRLQALELAEDTIVVFFADHGEEFAERQRIGHGHCVFNELVHVPLIVRVPGARPGRVRSPVANLDIGPTLAELCGVDFDVPAPGGESLVELLRDPDAARSAPVLSSRFAMVTAQDANGNEVSPRDFARLDSGDRNWIFYTRPRRNQPPFVRHYLFDWANDPHQTRDLAAEQGADVQALHRQLQEMDRALIQQRESYSFALSQELTPEMKKRLEELGYYDSDPESAVGDESSPAPSGAEGG